jgi:hypothetical protein
MIGMKHALAGTLTLKIPKTPKNNECEGNDEDVLTRGGSTLFSENQLIYTTRTTLAWVFGKLGLVVLKLSRQPGLLLKSIWMP